MSDSIQTPTEQAQRNNFVKLTPKLTMQEHEKPAGPCHQGKTSEHQEDHLPSAEAHLVHVGPQSNPPSHAQLVAVLADLLVFVDQLLLLLLQAPT